LSDEYSKRSDEVMTDEQKEKIKQMRQQGIGYKQIANEIGLSRDSVRGYCRKHGLDGFGK
jgi:DNA-binding CsgD family transcriptional regulator